MQQYDVFISYGAADRAVAKRVISELETRKSKVANRFEEQTSGILSMFSADAYANVDELINYSDFFVIIAGEALTGAGDGSFRQLRQMHIAAMRNKKVIYVDLTSRKEMVLRNIPAKNVVSRICVNADSESGVSDAVAKISMVVNQEEERKELYEKLSAYAKMGIANKEAELICNLVDSICERITDEQDETRKKEQFEELGRCLAKLSGKGALVSDEIKRKVAIALAKTKALIKAELEAEARKSPETIAETMKRLSAMPSGAGKVLAGAAAGAALLGPFGAIGGAFAGVAMDKAAKTIKKNIAESNVIEEKGQEKAAPEEKKENDLFRSVANFMHEGNKILQIIGENGEAEDFFRCLLVSYQRLKKYCEVVGETEIFGECVDRIAELKKRLKGFSGQKTTSGGIAEIGIKSLLGFETTENEKYDVFISHKSEDSDIAEGLYDFFRQNMLDPFFDKKTLTELAESEYRKAIMKALDNSTHFVVVLSDLEYMKSKWVAKEMEIFMSEKDEGRKNGNFIMLVTDDVYDEITKANKSNIPIDYRGYEIMKLGEYEERILGYVQKG